MKDCPPAAGCSAGRKLSAVRSLYELLQQKGLSLKVMPLPQINPMISQHRNLKTVLWLQLGQCWRTTLAPKLPWGQLRTLLGLCLSLASPSAQLTAFPSIGVVSRNINKGPANTSPTQHLISMQPNWQRIFVMHFYIYILICLIIQSSNNLDFDIFPVPSTQAVLLVTGELASQNWQQKQVQAWVTPCSPHW